MSSRSSISEPTDLGNIVVAAPTIVIVVEGEINHLLWTGQHLPKGGEIIVVRIKDFSVLRGVGRVTGWRYLTDSWGA